MIDNNLYKVMWAAESSHVIWNMKKEDHDEAGKLIQSLLGKYINVTAWCTDYERHYHKWLNEDDAAIHEIQSSINMTMIHAIMKLNKHENFRLYYWFDIDRTDNNSFKWQISPLSGERLVELNPTFHSNNRYVAENDFMVFPE